MHSGKHFNSILVSCVVIKDRFHNMRSEKYALKSEIVESEKNNGQYRNF